MILPLQTVPQAAGTATTPAMAAGLALGVWGVEDILALLQGK